MDLRFMFDEDVVNYDEMRPTYTKELFDDVIKYSKVNDSKAALEIGIGTGQATMPFLQTGCTIEAIEIGNNMAEFVKHKYAKYKNFHVTNVDFYDLRTYTSQIPPYYFQFQWLQ